MAYNHGIYQFGLFAGDTSAMAIPSGHVKTLCEEHGIFDMRSIQPQYSEVTRRYLADELDYKTFCAHRQAKNVLPEYEYCYR